MTPDELEAELVATERAALLGYKFALGARLTTFEVADICGVSHSGAWRILSKMSRVIPLTVVNGEWVLISHIDTSETIGC